MIKNILNNSSNKAVTIWLFITCLFIATLVIFGGYVRLTRSGLSIVEWEVVTGIIPPIGAEAWQSEFNKYQQTPEYQKINVGMSLENYKSIYYREYFHRLLGRVSGLVFVVPFFIFLLKGTIPLKKAKIYIAIGVLFALQGFLGWYMVSSGLIDVPSVSHYRLTAHLLLAFILFALCFWAALNTLNTAQHKTHSSKLLSLSIAFGIFVFIQAMYGGLVAGLKAGHVSNTFPLIFGYLVPPGLLSELDPWPINLISSALTVHFLHRWFAFVVWLASIWLYYVAKKRDYTQSIQRSILLIIIITTVQILLGISVIWWYVPVSLALIHQGTALVLFATAFFLIHQLVFLQTFLSGGNNDLIKTKTP